MKRLPIKQILTTLSEMKKPGNEHIVTILSVVTAIAGGAYFIDDRYASAADFESQVVYNDNYHLEKEIERAQDKLEGLLAIPSGDRRSWQAKEIIRLENLIKKLIRSKRA